MKASNPTQRLSATLKIGWKCLRMARPAKLPKVRLPSDLCWSDIGYRIAGDADAGGVFERLIGL